MAEAKEKLTLVTRKACFGLPTACPNCLPVYIYLRFCQRPFDLAFNLIHPDSGTPFFFLYLFILFLIPSEFEICCAYLRFTRLV